MASSPETQYAKSDDLYIAYQVTGEGPLDLVFIPGFTSHLELAWEEPRSARFFTRLSEFCRLIRFDKRGTGLSDRVSGVPSIEQRIDDIRAVMDAVHSQRAALMGVSEGGAMGILFSASHPNRSAALIAYGAFATARWAPDIPWGRTDEAVAARLKSVEASRASWGRGNSVDMYAPSLVDNPQYRRWAGRFERMAASPTAVLALLRMNYEIDIRCALATVAVPTLVLHRTGDKAISVEHGRYVAERIRGAKYVELPGNDHSPWTGDADAILDEVQAFLTGARRGPDPHRVLATVLFTDIVDATKRAAEMGDRSWKQLLEHHHFVVRQQLDYYRGREIDTAGDGFLAVFDGPARAVRCGRAIADAVKSLGIQLRVGVHTGECELMGEKLGGMAVHIGARVAAQAAPDEILVSSTVKDLVAGSGLSFESRGVHQLKGVPGEWTLLAAS
jgi:pimeloyl-ACP methyl ester carboxylesterase